LIQRKAGAAQSEFHHQAPAAELPFDIEIGTPPELRRTAAIWHGGEHGL
jgi:hypothetical protein